MRRTTLRRAVAAATVPTLMVAALTACGSDPEETSSGSDDTSSEGDAPAGDDYAEGEEVDKDAFVEDMAAGMKEASTAHVTMSVGMGEDPIQGEGDVDYTTTPVSMALEMTMPMIDQPLDMRLVEGVMYMNLGQMTNDKFVKYDLNDPENLPPEMQGMADQMDPLAVFEEFGPALSSVTYVGEEDVDGDSLDHFSMVLDPTKIEAFGELPAGSKDMPKEISYDAWFDDDFRIRQIKSSDDSGGFDMESTFSEWGESVEIEAPPASDVVETPPIG